MRSHEEEIAGELHQYETPEWSPLLGLLGAELADWFMWMHEVTLADGRALHAYKHTVTRRYLHLTADGVALAYTERGTYATLATWRAIDLAFEGWQHAGPTADDVAALDRALDRALASHKPA